MVSTKTNKITKTLGIYLGEKNKQDRKCQIQLKVGIAMHVYNNFKRPRSILFKILWINLLRIYL